jgi:perosamine synthetase
MTDLPALLGGPPVRPQGPPPWPLADPDILQALSQAYENGSWGKYHGGHCEQLEHLLKTHHQVDHILLCASGTFAVELALRALKVTPGDEVLLASYDFPGNFLAVHALGAHPVLVDVNPRNWNLAWENLDQALSPKTRVLLASHLHGGLVAMPEIMAWAAHRKILVVEDAAQCPGAMVFGRQAGTWGDVGTLSFGGSKLVSAGRGGALLTSHADIYQRARTWVLRGNLVCPLSELQATVILPQWRKLDQRNQKRLANVNLLKNLLADIPGLALFANPPGDHQPGYYKVGFQFQEESFGLDRARFVAAVRAEGIALDEGFAALHVGRSPRRYRAGSTLTEAEKAHHGTVILHHPVLLESDDAIHEVAVALHKIQKHASLLKRGQGEVIKDPENWGDRLGL